MQTIQFEAKSTLPILDSNFETVKYELHQNLKKYELEVTSSNVKEAKSLATELNKISKAIDNRRKEILQDVEEPIIIFKNQEKALVSMCQDGRSKILEQVKVFEDKTRETCKHLLVEELQQQYTEREIKEEFQTAEVNHLCIVSNVTESGNLTKSARDSISELTTKCLKTQNIIQERINKLGKIAVENGLDFIPSKEDIIAFLHEPIHGVYEAKLNQYITREKEKIEYRKDRIQKR